MDFVALFPCRRSFQIWLGGPGFVLAFETTSVKLIFRRWIAEVFEILDACLPSSCDCAQIDAHVVRADMFHLTTIMLTQHLGLAFRGVQDEVSMCIDLFDYTGHLYRIRIPMGSPLPNYVPDSMNTR